MIKTIAKPADKKVTGCGECRSTCQSACKTSCTVGNQSCERITREEKIERKYSLFRRLVDTAKTACNFTRLFLPRALAHYTRGRESLREQHDTRI